MSNILFSTFSDLTNLAREAAFGPLREMTAQSGVNIQTIPLNEIRPITLLDFETALTKVRTSVARDALNVYEKWNIQFGDVS